jgi:hypothetical protein
MTHCRTRLPSESAQTIFNTSLEYKWIYRVLGLVAVLLVTGCSTVVETKAPTQKDMLEAPAAELAHGYLAAITSLELLEKYVKAGAFSKSGANFMIKISGRIVNKDNVDENLRRFKKQVFVYEEAIKERGYADIAGMYKSEATMSCAKSNSLFAAAIQERLVTGIEIKQDNIDLQLVISLAQKGKETSIGTTAAIAETAIALIEPMNSDFYFLGEIRDRVIVLKPDVSVLNTWPRWARPPSRSDLEDCIVTLERL